jgi:hypothetical protein
MMNVRNAKKVEYCVIFAKSWGVCQIKTKSAHFLQNCVNCARFAAKTHFFWKGNENHQGMVRAALATQTFVGWPRPGTLTAARETGPFSVMGSSPGENENSM